MNLKIISAGAGSGKTYRLTQEMVGLLASGQVKAAGIIATTFTNKAAAELQERVRVSLLEKGMADAANDLSNALIGTVHGLGVKLLKRFAYEAGVSPQVDIIADEDQQVMFNQSLSTVLTNERVEQMEALSERLGLTKSDFGKTDWRKLLKEVVEVARANDFNDEVLEHSKLQSFETFARFLDTPSSRSPKDWSDRLASQIDEAIATLENNGDSTKVTTDAVKSLREIKSELKLREELPWHQWAKLTKVKVGAKSRDDVAGLTEFAASHLAHARLHEDVKSFIFNCFELVKEAMGEFERFKKSRGLIDYTDMEAYVKRLLNDPSVQEVLAEELDLLLVDEFQDTSPLQLEIFLKLSKYAKHSIWVGDPKQSIYGFRGAEPALMQAIVAAQGGLKKENILEDSWRSREDIVHATNAIFTKAFSNLPKEQVALRPKRTKLSQPNSAQHGAEPSEMGRALVHWHFKYDGEGRAPGKDWLYNCIATTLKQELDRGITILPKGDSAYRLAQPGDVAILCRSNGECAEVGAALHRAGLRAAISRAGLLGTAEARLVLACLKFILNRFDALSVAEILLLAGQMQLEQIVESRLEYLEMQESSSKPDHRWGDDSAFVNRLNELRPRVAELSGSEILVLLLDELDLPRLVAGWGNAQQRLANVDALVALSLKYEESCNRLHSAASLGGLLLWLNDLSQAGMDMQGAGDSPMAVNVVTYHKSKGLEYPVVVCTSLEQPLREEVWGIHLVQESAKVDMDNLLGSRWLRLWVNPYSDQFRNTVLDERLAASEERLAKRAASLAEEARLLYVGLTRARDYLILPTRDGKTPLWLNRVCNEGQEEVPSLDANTSESYWEWEGEILEKRTEVAYFQLAFGHAELIEKPLEWLESRAGRVDFPLVSEDEMNSEPQQSSVRIVEMESCYAPFNLPEVPERQLVASAMAAVLQAIRQTGGGGEEDFVESLTARFGTSNLVDASVFSEKRMLFWQFFANRHQLVSLTPKMPISSYSNGKLLVLEADIWMETRDGEMVVVQLSQFVGDAKSRQKRLKGMDRKIEQLMKAARFTTSDRRRFSFWICFVYYGELYKMELIY